MILQSFGENKGMVNENELCCSRYYSFKLYKSSLIFLFDANRLFYFTENKIFPRILLALLILFPHKLNTNFQILLLGE